MSCNENKKISIVHINTNDISGGAAKVAWRLSQAQRDRGIDSRMLIGRKQGNSIFSTAFDIESDPVAEKYCADNGLLDYHLQGSHKLFTHPQVKSADLLHLHNLHGRYFNPFSLPAISNFKPVIWTLHDMQAITGHCGFSIGCPKWETGCGNCPHLQLYPALNVDTSAKLLADKKHIYDHSHLNLVTPSKWLRKKVQKGILRNHPVELIYNGVDTNTFRPYDKAQARAKFGIPTNVPVIGVVAAGGALNNPYKGGEYIEAALEVLPGLIGNFVFVTIGGNYKTDNPRVINIPHITDESELAHAYSAFDVFLYSSKGDNCPLVILEALSCGIPIVSFDTGGVGELVIDGQQGCITPYCNLQKLVTALSQLVKNPEMQAKFQNSARQRAISMFDHKDIARQYENFYLRILEENKARTKTPERMQNTNTLRDHNAVNNIENTKVIHALPVEKNTFSGVATAALNGNKNEYLVSAILSVYNCDEFIRGCLDGLVNQTLFKKGLLQIVIVNGGSQQNEEAVIAEYQNKYGNIEYFKYQDRQTIYKCWSKAAKLAKGKYCVNTNSDDRLRYDALEIMASTLEANEKVGVVYADQIITSYPNETFENHRVDSHRKRPDYSKEEIIKNNPCGPQVMWRRSLHDHIGYFREDYEVGGDWDFWLRIIFETDYICHHIPEFLGLYYKNEQGLERGPARKLNLSREVAEIRSKYDEAFINDMHQIHFAQRLPENQAPEKIKNAPAFSLVMPNYNKAKYIGQAIESVLNQTFTEWELIIVDNCSTDRSLAAIEPYLTDSRIKLLTHQTNSGHHAALKTGIANINSEIFGVIDSSDALSPDALKVMYASHIVKPDCGLIYSQFHKCCDDLSIKNTGFCAPIADGMSNVDADVVSHFKTFKLRYYIRTAGFDLSNVLAGDKDITYQMEEVGKLHFVNETLYYHRELADSETHALGTIADGKAKLNAYIRRNLYAIRTSMYDPSENVKPALEKIMTNHPKDIAAFIRILEAMYKNNMLTALNLPEQLQSWPIENATLLIAATANFSDIVNVAGDKMVDMYNTICHTALEDGCSDANKDVAANTNEATKLFQQAQQAFANNDFQAATDYIGQYQSKMDYSLLPITTKTVTEKSTPEISVVIVTYNRSKDVQELIACLDRQDTSDFEVIVIDNSQGKDAAVSAMVDKYIDCPINFNPSEGRNIGAYFAKGQILVFIDDDALIGSDYISSIKQAFSEYEIFALRGKTLPKTNPEANKHVTIYDMGDKPFPTFCNQEGNSAFLRDIYREINGMDALLYGHEAPELTYRMIKKYGVTNKVIYWPKTIIYHDYGTGEKFAWKEQVYARSRSYIAAKHGQEFFSLRQSVTSEPMPPRKVQLNSSTPSLATHNAPKVSIVMPCYNSAKYLPECLDSILAQTMPDWELFILDDASTDETKTIIERYAASDRRIKPFYFKDNTGPYVRRNFAIKRACSHFIVIQDADDIMHHTKLQRFYDEINTDHSLGIVGSFYLRFLDDFKGEDYADKIEKSVTHQEIMQNFPNSYHIGWHASAIIRKTMFDTIGLYDVQPYGSDTFWMAKAGVYALETGRVKIKNLPEYLTYKREHLSSQTGTIPTQDPRGRRVKLEAYIINKLQEIQQKVRSNSALDIRNELRNCTCSDFLTKYSHMFDQWETAPMTDQLIQKMVDKAFAQFASRQFASCAITLNTMERIAPEAVASFKNIDLLAGLAYFAIDDANKSRRCISREYKNHRSKTALSFIETYLDSSDPSLTAADRHRIVQNTWYSAEMNSTVRNDYLTLLKDGVAQLNASLPDIALEHFDRALRSGCNLSCLHHARAVALMQLGRNNEAAQAYRAEIAASPEKINNYNINKADDNLAIQIN